MSSPNGVDLVEESYVKEDERSNCLANKDKNSSAFVSYHGCLVFRLFCSSFAFFGYIQSKNEVAPLEYIYFFFNRPDGG